MNRKTRGGKKTRNSSPDAKVSIEANTFSKITAKAANGKQHQTTPATQSGHRTDQITPLWPTVPQTDSGNAELFASKYGDKLRYDHTQKRWLTWNGNTWEEDASERTVRMLAKAVARHRRDMAKFIENETDFKRELKWARTSESRPRREAMLELVKYEAPISDPGTGWDNQPGLLAVGNGVVDLRTGELRPGNPDDRLTMQSWVRYNPDAKAPRWEKFLNEIFMGDEELVEFIHHAVGYSATGDTSEQVIFLLWGTGANGKSTFLEIIRKVLSGYAINLPFSVFELRSRSAIPNDVATLVGRRFATANETNEAVELNEARIKSLTGSDPITVRKLYKEYFTFLPQSKYWLAFNHKPRVTDDSPGFWRRVRIVPFAKSFTQNPEKNLIEILHAEAEGILRWIAKGAMKWYQMGLGLPRAVKEASERYRQESDLLSEFLDQRCDVGPGISSAAADLWREYRDWCEVNGERPATRTVFSQKLQSRGFQKVRFGKERTWIWTGIALRRTRQDVVFQKSVTEQPSPPAAA